MKKISVGMILLLALIGFGLQPTKGKPVPVDLSELRELPPTLGTFHEVTNNDAELANSPAYTDGSEGLERDYLDETGAKFNVYVAPQTIGQHVPIFCFRYGGYTILSETQHVLPDNTQIRFNRILVRDSSTSTVSTCVYFWKSANGVFVPEPNHSLGMIAVRWADHQQGLLVEICAKGQKASTPEADESLQRLLRSSYPEIEKLYPAVFRSTGIH